MSWTLTLPECRTCAVRFAADWNVKLCAHCLAEVGQLEEAFNREARE